MVAVMAEMEEVVCGIWNMVNFGWLAFTKLTADRAGEGY